MGLILLEALLALVVLVDCVVDDVFRAQGRRAEGAAAGQKYRTAHALRRGPDVCKVSSYKAPADWPIPL
jgi:hypothetical protein